MHTIQQDGSYVYSLYTPCLHSRAVWYTSQQGTWALAAEQSEAEVCCRQCGAALHLGTTHPNSLHADLHGCCWLLQDVVALIAYERPEQSPLAHLLQLSQREVVADAVNAAILQVAAAGGTGSSSPGTVATGSSKPQVQRQQCVGGGWDAGGHRWASPTGTGADRDSMQLNT